VVGYAGHLYAWKGVDVLLEALVRLPDVQGLIIGGHQAEPDLARVKSLAERLGLSGRITFTGLVEPSVRAAHGSGSQRLYSFRDILVLKVVKRLLDTGISLQQIRAAVQHLRDRGSADLAQVTLMSDGVSVYECASADEVVDLLAGGQGVFGIALGRIWQEVDGTLAELPAEQAELPEGQQADADGASSRDELARRRARRTG